MLNRSEWDDFPVVLDIPLVCMVLGCSPTTARLTVQNLPHAKVGREYRICRDVLRRFMEGGVDSAAL